MSISVTLPGGYIDEFDVIHTQALIEPMTGKEEELLADSFTDNSASLVTELLVRLVKSIGSITPVTKQIAQHFLVGDRMFLLMKIREITFGKEINSVVQCPVSQCQKRIDLTFLSAQVPVKTQSGLKRFYTCTIPENVVTHTWKGKTIKYRLPNGADQEHIGTVPLKNQAHGLYMLLERCIQEIDGNAVDTIGDIPPDVVRYLEASMEQNAPGLDLNIETRCPECESQISFTFALQDFFFGEVSINKNLLYREIHYLAYHYHWSESELLSLTRNKRRSYIDILSEEIERMNDEQN